MKHEETSAETCPSGGPSVLFPPGTRVENWCVCVCLVNTVTTRTPLLVSPWGGVLAAAPHARGGELFKTPAVAALSRAVSEDRGQTS